MAREGIRRWLGVALVAAMAACSRPVEPPRGAAGLAFGDPPPAGLVAVAVPLPDGVAGRLRFFTRPGPTETFFGIALAEPVLAFFEERFFSLSAALADPAAGPGLRERLTRAYGPGYCRHAAELAVCLWRAADVDMVLETPADGAPRFMVRHRPLAGLVAAAAGPDQAAGLESAPEPVRAPGR
uniref:Lipoprotein n=1 Tax=Desulfovibrio sp. U5L TaxID=596152 RepID=I2PZV6_9BACT